MSVNWTLTRVNIIPELTMKCYTEKSTLGNNGQFAVWHPHCSTLFSGNSATLLASPRTLIMEMPGHSSPNHRFYVLCCPSHHMNDRTPNDLKRTPHWHCNAPLNIHCVRQPLYPGHKNRQHWWRNYRGGGDHCSQEIVVLTSLGQGGSIE
jgi:hypothetical protein